MLPLSCDVTGGIYVSAVPTARDMALRLSAGGAKRARRFAYFRVCQETTACTFLLVHRSPVRIAALNCLVYLSFMVAEAKPRSDQSFALMLLFILHNVCCCTCLWQKWRCQKENPISWKSASKRCIVSEKRLSKHGRRRCLLWEETCRRRTAIWSCRRGQEGRRATIGPACFSKCTPDGQMREASPVSAETEEFLSFDYSRTVVFINTWYQ